MYRFKAIVALAFMCSKNMAKEKKEHSFFEKEDRCRRVFEWTVLKHGGVWHLCTPGEKQPIVFKRPEDYAFAMTLTAMCAHDCPNVQVITFEIMSNHVHFILCGSESDVMAFFGLFRKRLLRYCSARDERTDLTHFQCEKPIPITTLDSMRNQICYTNRNNFVVDPGHTPFSYPYGANSCYFMPMIRERKHRLFGDLTDTFLPTISVVSTSGKPCFVTRVTISTCWPKELNRTARLPRSLEMPSFTRMMNCSM